MDSTKTQRHRRVRTPTVLQLEAVECGAAALGIVLGYYGRVVPLAELRRECGVSRDGSTAANVIEAARHYGLQAVGFSMEVATLQEVRGPTIVFWNFNHFVVVEGFHRQHVYLNDPASGPRTVSLEEFSQAFTGIVLVMEPGPDFTPGGQQPGTIHALRTRLQGSGSALAYAAMAGFLLVLPGLVRPVLTQVFVDQVLIEGLQDWVRPLLLGLLLTAAFHAGLLRLQLQALRRLHLKLTTMLSGQFLWHLLHLPSSFYAQRYAGEISQRVQLNERVAEALSGRLATTVIDALVMLVYASVMLQYDVLLTLLGVGCALVNGLALRWLARRRMDANMRGLQEVGKLNGVAMAGLRSIETLKAAALESDFFARWAGYYAKAANAQQALQMTNQTLGVLPSLLSALATMLVLVIGGLRVIDGHLSLGMLVALQSLMHSFLAPVNSLVGFGSTLQDLQGTLQRLDDVLHNPAPAVRVSLPESRSVPPAASLFQGTVHVRNVTFGYSRVHPPLLENVSFALRPGQRVALVGASGSGKSTLARLVCGLYEPWQGDIRFDGIPRSQIPRQLLSRALALVDQDIVLFAGTVRENLTLWDATVPGGQLIRACKDALIHDVVLTLPGGYDGELLEGAANLSGGQRQRLEIARALVQDPMFLVMDEATSALDAETEYRLMQQLRKRGCTCLFVAHRLSTIRDCDTIIVLDHGKVVQQGTHAALLREGGVYTRLLAEAGEDIRVKPYHVQPSTALARASIKHGPDSRGKARQRHAPQRHAEVLEALAAGFDPQASSPSVVEEPLLLAAARAVGEMLGVPIRSPAPSEGFQPVKDPLESIARASHLRLRRVALTDHWWQRDCGPLIAYIREDRRPVALLPVSATCYTLFDPLHRTHTPVHSRLTATLAPEAHTLSRPFPNRVLRWGDLLTFGLRGCGQDLRLVLLSGIAVTLLGMLMPQATALFIDHAVPDADRGMVLQLAAALLAAACGQALFHLAQGVALLRRSTTASATVQAALWDRLLALPAVFFRQYTAGDLQTRVMAMSAMQRHLSGATLRTLCTSGLALLNLGLMLYYSVPLALVASAVALIACLATGIAGACSIRQVRRLQHLTGALLGMTAQLITGVAKLQAAGAQERAFASWSQIFSQKQRVRQRLQGITDTMTVVNAVLPTLASVVLFWGALRVFSSGASMLTAGTFIAFHAAFGLFIAGATSLSNTLIDLLEVTTLWERVRPIVVTTSEVDTGKVDPGRLTGKVALEDVTFRYQEHSPVILDKVSLHAEPGEFIALVGPSGSGKSTTFRLLLGFETPQAGAVSYDDQELSRLDVVAVRRQLGAVLQHSTIMAATIFENIAAGALITQQEAWEAIHAAGLAEDIVAMPMGLHTFVSEGGSNLSGGQRQRLLIARALVRQPALVLFDEATSALDNRTQAVATASLERLRMTRVVIAHRLSTIRHADRIYVLVGGRVVQQGTFAELAQRAGPFAQLMAQQGESGGMRERSVLR